ncbi:MAG: peroxiredoxin [Deltaproteobacteria bacterium]|jgi:predicted peroxiredoxin|nr:DsrE family protein [Deltaproteobacteria bacterium]MBW2628081.1 DsrE family protein [Deltaproteobacteria bacterium]RLB41593.1 MAG: peroxiredoxin [Deltaproteobacteria bacterium]
MSEESRKLVVLITQGLESELSSVAFTIANGGITSGLDVSIFLTSSAVDLARKRAVDATQVHPLEPLSDLVQDFVKRGGNLWACTPCIKGRGYEQDDLIEGTVITGASVMHELIQGGAATLSF